jgi:hypothetical protein
MNRMPAGKTSHHTTLPMERPMKIQVLLAACVVGAALSTPSFAQNSQQSKMTMCNKQAGERKGDERKAFMKSCLSAKPTMSPQERMKDCNKQAGERKGDDRKAFMKSCLSNKG